MLVFFSAACTIFLSNLHIYVIFCQTQVSSSGSIAPPWSAVDPAGLRELRVGVRSAAGECLGRHAAAHDLRPAQWAQGTPMHLLRQNEKRLTVQLKKSSFALLFS